MVTRLIPLANRIVVVPITEDDYNIYFKKGEVKSKSGLFIPAEGKGDAFHAKIVAVGRGYVKKDGKIHPMDYKVGDIVMYGRGCGTEYNFKSVKHLVLSDDDVLAIFKGKKNLL